MSNIRNTPEHPVEGPSGVSLMNAQKLIRKIRLLYTHKYSVPAASFDVMYEPQVGHHVEVAAVAVAC
jgi:hypothetical protein